ncbi:MAG: aminotransferase class I/II-fold pyridoxal phosphate-dependent enzyme [Acidimicrobiales bacterium]
MTDLFDKCDSPRVEEYRAAEAVGLAPFFRLMASQSGPVVVHEGREVIMLGSNNYLGLTVDDRVRRAAQEALDRYGTGCTGSRLMNGTLPLHNELESELCDWLGGESCLVFTTGYAANLGLLSTLVGPEDVVIADAASHASVIDGARLAPGMLRFFRHSSVESLARRLQTWKERSVGGAMVAVEGVYSMEGDVPPLGPMSDVTRAAGARLVVDEAHSLGVLGPKGAGAAADAGIEPDVVVGTFSKSLASCGGFIMAPGPVIEFLRIAARPFLFTASGVPAALGAALAAMRIAREEDWRREAVRERAAQLRRGLVELGYEVAPSGDSAIVPVRIGDDWAAARTWRTLLDHGVYTNCALAPAVPKGRALLRASVMATHTEAHVKAALAAFEVARSTSA